MSQRVAVIGVGVSGLSALRHLSNDPEHFAPVAFDTAETVGGLWVYSDQTKVDKHGLPVHSAVYQNLRTNVAKNIMGYQELAMPEDAEAFPSHDQINSYLQHYAENFDLLKYIKFQTLVKRVDPEEADGHVTWKVTTLDLVTQEETTSCFDSVMVCNGHEFAPSIPDIAGKENFSGEILHSKNYRRPQSYEDKTVVIVGMSFSGLDLLYGISPVAKQIYCSHNNPASLISEMPSNATQKRGVREITPDGVIFNDGGYVQCDVIIFCTGYHYSLPFLQDGCKLIIKDDRITPLYKHLVHIDFPTLFLIGLPKRSLTFKLSNVQAAYACALLRGDAILPPADDMRRDEEADFRRRITDAGQHPKMTHDLFGPDCSPQWEYFDFLTKEINSTPLEEVTRKLFQYHAHLWATRFHDFRTLEFEIINHQDFKFV